MRVLALSAILVVLPASEGRARLLLTQSQALGLAFPAGTAVERRTAYLTGPQAEKVQALAKAKLDSKVWTYYVGLASGAVVGTAYFDRVVVRTMPATLMAAVDADGSLKFLEVLTFDEPEDYRAGPRWLAQLRGRRLGADLRAGGVLRNMAGATLTSAALADSARRLLAIHAVLNGGAP